MKFNHKKLTGFDFKLTLENPNFIIYDKPGKRWIYSRPAYTWTYLEKGKYRWSGQLFHIDQAGEVIDGGFTI